MFGSSFVVTMFLGYKLCTDVMPVYYPFKMCIHKEHTLVGQAIFPLGGMDNLFLPFFSCT